MQRENITVSEEFANIVNGILNKDREVAIQNLNEKFSSYKVETRPAEKEKPQVTQEFLESVQSINKKSQPVLNESLVSRVPVIHEMFKSFDNVTKSRASIVSEEFNKYADKKIRHNTEAKGLFVKLVESYKPE